MKTLKQDSVEIPKLKLRASQLYSQVCKKIANPTAEEILKIVDKFSERFPKEDVLAVMHTLTQYSNMQSVCGLYDNFKSNNIESFRGFGSCNYYDLHRNSLGEDAMLLRYKIPIGYLPSISDIFAYFFDTEYGKSKLPYSDYRATILDKRTVKILQEYKDKAPIRLSQMINELDKFVYIKNFEGTCNFLEGQQDLVAKTEEILDKLAELKSKNPNVSTQKLINFIFNKTNRDDIEKLGLPYVVVETNSKRRPTVDSIVKNLSQKIPTEKEFIELVDKFIRSITDDEILQLQYLNDIKDKFMLYTFKDISQKLVSLKSIIENEVEGQGGDKNSIYYFVPNNTKSYGLIASMYQKVNNIPEDRFIDIEAIDFNMKKENIHNNLKEQLKKTTIVILDDASITGESLNFDLNYKIQEEPKLLFATVFATPRAKNNLISEGCPKLISVDSMNLESEDKVKQNSLFNNHSMLLFPYTAPDNNISIFKKLVEKFYPRKGFVQEPWEY